MACLIMVLFLTGIFSYTETASTGYRAYNRFPVIHFSLSSFALHQLLQRLQTCYQVQLLSCPLFNIGYRGPDWTGRPTWGSASLYRPVAKFNGHSSLPVFTSYRISPVKDFHKLRRITVCTELLVTEKTK